MSLLIEGEKFGLLCFLLPLGISLLSLLLMILLKCAVVLFRIYGDVMCVCGLAPENKPH